MTVATKLMTAEEFWQRASEFSRFELVRGVPVPIGQADAQGGKISPTGRRHGRIELNLGAALRVFLTSHALGEAYAGEVGFILARNPDIVRAPDVAFVSHERLKDAPVEGFLPFAPDLAAEVVSPNDTVREISGKVFEYLDAGTRMVWVVDPDNRAITVYGSRTKVVVLTEHDKLDGGDILPDFSVSIREIFA